MDRQQIDSESLIQLSFVLFVSVVHCLKLIEVCCMLSFNLLSCLNFLPMYMYGNLINIDFHKLCSINFVIFSFPCDKNWLSLLKLKC